MVEARTTAAAARRLGLSQSAISRSLASLESRLGLTLFEREAGRLVPTGAAFDLNDRLDALFEALDRLDTPSETSQQTLRLIAPPSLTQGFLTDHIASFTRSRPDYFVSLEFGSSDDVFRTIHKNRFDLGLAAVEPTLSGTLPVPFCRSQPVVAMPRDHPLAEKSEVDVTDLDGQDLIVLNHRHVRRSQLDRLLAESGARPHRVAEASTTLDALALVSAGLGVAQINPFPATRTHPGTLVFRRFRADLAYQAYFITPDNRPVTRIARHFMQHVRLHTSHDAFSQPV